jgi:hypothetical protein
LYLSTWIFWLIWVNDQNSNVFESDDPESVFDPGVQPTTRSTAVAKAAVVVMTRFKRPSGDRERQRSRVIAINGIIRCRTTPRAIAQA